MEAGIRGGELLFRDVHGFGPVTFFALFHAFVNAVALAIAENRRRLGEVPRITEIDSKVLNNFR